MVFFAVGLDRVVFGSALSEKAQKDKWNKLNALMFFYLYMMIEKDFQFLVEDKNTTFAR